ncbi:bypass of stop codon protein 1-like [Melanotaenia boesemani]|uniref:bypass of stop codon protein 1-like n=1 Tax=Melanotaenia boesemani TaxID=1250792 RepID=UPI001C03B286|nr:bypass of stop codon protein 1-like [Melanotaenia boesemani]
MRSHFNTNLVTVYGDRKPTTTATPTTLTTAGNNVTIVDTTTTSTTNSTTTTSPSTANATITNSGSASNITASGSRIKRDAPRENKKKSKSKESLVSSNEKEMEDDEHEDDEEDSPENKPMMGSSLGYYGIFQLSDSHFCDSGYRSSKNLCRSSCSAFADDDITDDVACVVGSGYWKHLLEEASKQCQRAKKTYFAECAA